MRELQKLIDINTNRACEGLRILEDGVRYRPFSNLGWRL